MLRAPSAAALRLEMAAASTSIVKVEKNWATTMFVSVDTEADPEYIAKCYMKKWRTVMVNLDDCHRKKAELSPGSNFLTNSIQYVSI